jgi:hypothetical protein
LLRLVPQQRTVFVGSKRFVTVSLLPNAPQYEALPWVTVEVVRLELHTWYV